MPHVAIVTSAQPSANPRMMKEVTALQKVGYHVTVIWSPISHWADEFDRQLFKDHPTIQWVQAGYHYKSQQIRFYYARVRQQIWKLIYRFLGNVFEAGIKSQVFFSQELTKKAKSIKADLYVGHNLGALPAIVKAASLHNVKSIFDFEDFHRGEHRPDSIQSKAVKNIEDKYIPHVHGISASSSLIAQAYEKIYTGKKIITINNVFPISFAVTEVKDIPVRPLKLFWFSQYIGKGRGIENIIRSISLHENADIELTLLGFCSREMEIYLNNLLSACGLSSNQVKFISSVKTTEIVNIASNYHIGIASEPGRDQNNELALSNKIMTYLLAGNAVVLSNTISQEYFFNANQGIGSIYEKENPESLSLVFKKYIADPQFLKQHRINALELGKSKFNWDFEKKVFLEHVNAVLAS